MSMCGFVSDYLYVILNQLRFGIEFTTLFAMNWLISFSCG